MRHYGHALLLDSFAALLSTPSGANRAVLRQPNFCGSRRVRQLLTRNDAQQWPRWRGSSRSSA